MVLLVLKGMKPATLHTLVNIPISKPQFANVSWAGAVRGLEVIQKFPFLSDSLPKDVKPNPALLQITETFLPRTPDTSIGTTAKSCPKAPGLADT